MNLESLIVDPWPQEISTAADNFHQGHLIENVQLLYMGSPQAPATSFTARNAASDGSRSLHPLVLPKGLTYEYCVITSATCDVAEAGKHKNPFFQVSPVFDISGNLRPGQENLVKQGRFTDFVYLTLQPRHGVWVVDLRVSMPIEKGALVGRIPIEGFAAEEDRIAFATRLARRVSRAALDGTVHDNVIASLSTWMARREKEILNRGSGAFTDVERVALNIDGDRLKPQAVQVIVFEETKLDRDDKAVWRDWWKTSKGQLRSAGILLKPIHFTSLAKMSARDYERLVPLSIPTLGRTAHWSI
ncbi:hypothetical protein ABT270_04620 [Streptomyces sp900105245]|uniref:hypothetical protein n=1 Tax=Streptomyces sp. 900105245 TaxID=3154379 RepID=UPI0033244292